MFNLHEHWAIRTFVPLLKLLNIQNIPGLPIANKVNLAEHRNFILKGMKNCIICIRQGNLPKSIGGLTITSHKKIQIDDISTPIHSFRINIIINSHLYRKTSPKGKSRKKLTAIHEFTHAVAALTAISRISSDDTIEKFKKKLNEKAHVLDLQELSHLAKEINEPFIQVILNKLTGIPKERHFPDEHYRLGFEDIRISYPLILEEFLLPYEVLSSYFLPNTIQQMCVSFGRNNIQFNAIIRPILRQICNDENLDKEFVTRRFYTNLFAPAFRIYRIRHAY